MTYALAMLSGNVCRVIKSPLTECPDIIRAGVLASVTHVMIPSESIPSRVAAHISNTTDILTLLWSNQQSINILS
jgi:hypothetical protein